MTTAAETGDRRTLLRALRRHLAAVMDDDPPAHALARLTTVLADLDNELRALEEAERMPLRVVTDERFDPGAI